MRIYIDADFTISYSVGNAIAQGIRTALAEVNFKIAGVPIQIIDKNHKGSPERSFRTMNSFLADDRALVMFGGMHSPPYLVHKSFMNENRLLTLLPWSAAGPITRAAEGEENWIFRLSVDDSVAGSFLINRAIQKENCSRVALLLMDSGWGRANRVEMTRTLGELNQSPVFVTLFESTIEKPAADKIVSEIIKTNADCAILLAQATEAAYFSHAFENADYPIKVLSHWAILGAKYTSDVSHKTRRFIALQVLQTCGLAAEYEQPERIALALKELGMDVQRLSDMTVPAGFIHGYDLTKLFISAANQAATTHDWMGSILERRRAVKQALERLRDPVSGILKDYRTPFSTYTIENRNAHEALGADDLCMAEYDPQGKLQHVQD